MISNSLKKYHQKIFPLLWIVNLLTGCASLQATHFQRNMLAEGQEVVTSNDMLLPINTTSNIEEGLYKNKGLPPAPPESPSHKNLTYDSYDPAIEKSSHNSLNNNQIQSPPPFFSSTTHLNFEVNSPNPEKREIGNNHNPDLLRRFSTPHPQIQNTPYWKLSDAQVKMLFDAPPFTLVLIRSEENKGCVWCCGCGHKKLRSVTIASVSNGLTLQLKHNRQTNALFPANQISPEAIHIFTGGPFKVIAEPASYNFRRGDFLSMEFGKNGRWEFPLRW